jgi:23S rRNA pseudouridine2605 synthase
MTALQRVQKLISQAGYCSRRKAEDLIKNGDVKVNGTKITIGDKADPATDTITVKGKRICFPDRLYYKFYKPAQVLTTLSEPGDRRTITSFISTIPGRVMPVGRLDYDTEGLLFLTNDGDFANNIMHPRYEHKKTYAVTLDKSFPDSLLDEFTDPIGLEDGPFEVDSYKRISSDSLKITIHEGRNRIVKRLFSHFGYTVTHLKRTAISGVILGTLRPGQYTELSEQELQKLSASPQQPKQTKE